MESEKLIHKLKYRSRVLDPAEGQLSSTYCGQKVEYDEATYFYKKVSCPDCLNGGRVDFLITGNIYKLIDDLEALGFFWDNQLKGMRRNNIFRDDANLKYFRGMRGVKVNEIIKS